MDKFVARHNIDHFRKQLAEETDETKRLLLALSTPSWWHCQHDTASDRTPLAPMLPRVMGGPAISDKRRTVNGILWVLRTGAPWRDLPHGP